MIRILVVEDDDLIVNLLASVLRRYHEHELATWYIAKNIGDAIALMDLAGTPPDLVILDYDVGGPIADFIGRVRAKCAKEDVLLFGTGESDFAGWVRNLEILVIEKPITFVPLKTFLDSRIAALTGEQPPVDD